jgi:hypothetical protein
MNRRMTIALVVYASASIFAQQLRAQSQPCLDKKMPYPTFADEIQQVNGEQRGSNAIVSDFRFKGLVHDPDVVRARILKEIQELDFHGSRSEWLEHVAEHVVRDDFQNRGYFEVNVDDLDVQPLDPNDPQRGVIVVAPIKEGDKFFTGDISIVSADPESTLTIPGNELRQQLKVEKGDPVDVNKIRKGIEAITRIYADRGFMDTIVTPDFSVDYKTDVIEFTMRVSEGQKYFVEKFEVFGVDDGTKAAIEARVKPGSVYDNALMQELFNQGKPASPSDLSFMNGMTVTRNVEKASVNIVFDFATCPPPKN